MVSGAETARITFHQQTSIRVVLDPLANMHLRRISAGQRVLAAEVEASTFERLQLSQYLFTIMRMRIAQHMNLDRFLARLVASSLEAR